MRQYPNGWSLACHLTHPWKGPILGGDTSYVRYRPGKGLTGGRLVASTFVSRRVEKVSAVNRAPPPGDMQDRHVRSTMTTTGGPPQSTSKSGAAAALREDARSSVCLDLSGRR